MLERLIKSRYLIKFLLKRRMVVVIKFVSWVKDFGFRCLKGRVIFEIKIVI